MFIKLTNASEQFKNKPLVITTDIIVSVFETEIVIESADVDNVVTLPAKEIVTAVYCGTIGLYHVRETVEAVYEMLK